jgi:CPA2 family monovalent cation:H+ antiporter-2
MAAAAFDPGVYQEALVILGAASVVVPIFHRLRASPLIGFILSGMLVGPYGLGALKNAPDWVGWVTISDPAVIAPYAEFGIVLLLFMIGLELSFERLGMMRRIVFGLGPLQLALSALAIAGVALALGRSMTAAAVIGLALAVSSTAVIVQTLAHAKRLHAPVGRAAFGVLLFQDLAVAPILVAVAVIGAADAGDAGAGLGQFAATLGQAALGVALIIAAGRIFLRPLFRRVARTNSPELFMAACLLVIVGAGIAAVSAGLSMALGALIGGVLLAETEYRRQIEVMIEPFKGLLLGVFLITVGMSVDIGRFMAAPLWILAGVVGLFVVKGLIAFGAARLVGVPALPSAQAAALLAPGSEFTFVILGAAAAAGVVDRAAADYALLLAALTMALIPFIWQAAAWFERRRPVQTAQALQFAPDAQGPLSPTPRVLVVGFGRVGEQVAAALEENAVPYIALDRDPDLVARARKAGKPIYFGDAAREDLLLNCHLDTARALVVTMDSPRAAAETVEAARRLRGDLVIVARARDAKDAAGLYRLGASDVAPETVESSLQLAEAVLVGVGVPVGHAIATIHARRAAIRHEIQTLAPEAAVRSRRAAHGLPTELDDDSD